MDLHFTQDVETDAERRAVDAVLGPADPAGSNGGHDARGRRHLLLPVLHALSARAGWISPGGLNYACRRLAVPPAEAYGVASFYASFSTVPRAPAVLYVCDDIACAAAGSERIARSLDDVCGPPGETTDGQPATWLRSPCLGLCDRAPAALFECAGEAPFARQYAPASAALAVDLLRRGSDAQPARNPKAHVGGTHRQLLRRVGTIDPERLDDYRGAGGYRALERAFDIGASGAIAECVASKLLGRGGAAFPTGRKMQAVASASARPHYLVCNADESEPGTFKDRVLLEDDPFSIVEAMTIAAYATDCERGFAYVRGEYPLAAQRLDNAIRAARAAGLLGRDVMGRGFAFDIEIRRGAGAYICGEETALFNSIEGRRGEPRSKPPFPVEAGLFGKPTLVNNVETLANLLPILADGGAAYAKLGTAASTGTRLFCLSGAIVQPGVYEVEHGTTLRALLALAGGISPDDLGAILLGGAAGSFVGAQALDMPLTFEAAREAGTTLGSGVVMVFERGADLDATLLRIARFFREESCGQCVPCRVGTVRQEEALARIASAGSADREADLILLDDIGRAMRDASICGLGQTAANAILSARRLPNVCISETLA